jgi:hypothetical protein
MELTPGSETSTHLIQTPGLYPKENTLQQQHGESLKTKKLDGCLVSANNKLVDAFHVLSGATYQFGPRPPHF